MDEGLESGNKRLLSVNSASEDGAVLQGDPDGCTQLQATVNMMKLVVGVGSFALPGAFVDSGLWGGIVGVPLLALLCVYCIDVLVRCKHSVAPDALFFDISRAYFGRFGTALMYAAAMFASLGACAGYLDFMTPLVSDVIGGSHLVIVVLTYPLFVLLCWIRNFRLLSFTSILGDIAFVTAMATVFMDGFSHHSLHYESVNKLPPDVEGLGTFMGAAVFLYGIAMFILPIESQMKDRREFMPAVYHAFGWTTGLNVLFGALGYLLWGNGVEGNVIDSLSHGGFTEAAKILLYLDLTFSFPIVMTTARDIFERFLLGDADQSAAGALPGFDWFRGQSDTWVRNLARAFLVFVCAAFAVAVPDFVEVVTIVSGLALISTALVFPPLCWLVAKRASLPGSKQLWFGALAAFGLFMSVLTTYQAIDGLDL